VSAPEAVLGPQLLEFGRSDLGGWEHLRLPSLVQSSQVQAEAVAAQSSQGLALSARSGVSFGKHGLDQRAIN
jgi:hypothetical protein